MKIIMQKLRLYRIMRLGYGIRWYDVSKGRRKYYLWLYESGDYEKLHQCLYAKAKGDPYSNHGWLWYINYKGEINCDGIVAERKRMKKKAKGAK
jgi:hypothetical protein